MESVPSEARRRLLLVCQRPLDLHGGASRRWRYLLGQLPRHGWSVLPISSARVPPAPVSYEAVAPRPGLRRAVLRTLRAAARVAAADPVAFVPNPAWAISGRAEVARAIAYHRPHCVWATCPPHTGMFAASATAARSGVPLVVELRDLWAGNPTYDAGRPLLAALEERAFRRAERIVTVTPEAHERLARLHPELADRLEMIPNGFDPAVLKWRRPKARPAKSRIEIVHTGAFYGERSPEGLIEGLARSNLSDSIRLRLIGELNARTATALKEAPPHLEVEIEEKMSWEDAIAAMAAADVALVLFTPGDDTAVPGKLYEALALGIPILSLVRPQSAMARLLHDLDADAGVATHDDPEAIATAVRRLAADPPPPMPLERLTGFDASRLAKRVASLLDEIADAGR